jgi:hypothetical protein
MKNNETARTTVGGVTSLVQLADVSRGTRPSVGDVFELRLAMGIRLYGIVYHVDAHWHELRRGFKLVGVHVPVADDVSWESLTFERRDLVTATFVTDTTGWRWGYFRTVGRRQLSSGEQEAPSSVYAHARRRNVLELRDPRAWELRDDEPPLSQTYNGADSIGWMVTKVLTKELEWGDFRRLWPSPIRPGWYTDVQGSDRLTGYISPKQRPLPPDTGPIA